VMANFWMHNGHLQVEGEKMSKSLGNFVTIRELLRTCNFGGRSWPGQVVRFAMLQTHYAQPIDWTIKRLVEAADELGWWALNLARWYEEVINSNTLSGESASPGLVEQLTDDLNTPGAIAVLRKLFSDAERGDEGSKLSVLMDCEFLGILSRERDFKLAPGGVSEVRPMSFEDLDLVQEINTAIANFNSGAVESYQSELARRGWQANVEPDGFVTLSILPDDRGRLQRERHEKIKSLIAARDNARKNKDFVESDRIRDELEAMGVRLKDRKDGTTAWEVKR
jgi:cysteinyl-tRNA synthetase